MGRSKSSIDYLKKVISIKPEHDKSWFTLGSAYESDGNFEEAIKHYLKAIDLNASYSKAYGNLGKLYINKGSLKDAEDILKTVPLKLMIAMLTALCILEYYISSKKNSRVLQKIY